MSNAIKHDRKDLKPEEIRIAVRERINRFPAPWPTLLHIDENGSSIERTRVDWLVRIQADSSLAMQKSFEIHQRLSELQSGVEDDLGAYITVFLDH